MSMTLLYPGASSSGTGSDSTRTDSSGANSSRDRGRPTSSDRRGSMNLVRSDFGGGVGGGNEYEYEYSGGSDGDGSHTILSRATSSSVHLPLGMGMMGAGISSSGGLNSSTTTRRYLVLPRRSPCPHLTNTIREEAAMVEADHQEDTRRMTRDKSSRSHSALYRSTAPMSSQGSLSKASRSSRTRSMHIINRRAMGVEICWAGYGHADAYEAGAVGGWAATVALCRFLCEAPATPDAIVGEASLSVRRRRRMSAPGASSPLPLPLRDSNRNSRFPQQKIPGWPYAGDDGGAGYTPAAQAGGTNESPYLITVDGHYLYHSAIAYPARLLFFRTHICKFDSGS
ncbi:hypothetical protein CVT25_000317 [Psilocybe cyanescens]|uniref:Uncharacterized protein n=1 Tax=Psilocybe cyanescens TaxID=93625 RepID=A0A409XEY0_PSICY|nr:hypothetical protein CVT25_000317 [Psilocybe cyanescens]